MTEIKMTKYVLAFCLSLIVAGCVQFSEGGAISDPHTGVTGYHSGEFDMSVQTAAFVSGEILHTDGKDGSYGVIATVTRPTTDPIRIESAMSFGRKIVVSAGPVDFSCGSSGCRVSEDFTMLLTRDDIKAGVAGGMEIKVMGRNGSFLMKIPKEAFQSIVAVMAN